MEKPGAPTSGHPAPEARATRGSSVEEKGAATVDSPLEAKGAAMGAAISHCRSPSLSRTRLTKEKPRLMDWKGAASSDSTMEEKGAASSESTMEEKGATSSDSTMEEKGATMGEATRASPLKEKRPRRPMPRPLTCAQWWRREDASLRKRTRQMMELFPDFNPDEEYAYSNSENLSGWESGSDDGADEVMSHVMANSAPPVTVVPDQNIKPGNEDKQRGKVVEEEGEGELSNTMTVQDGGFTNPAGAEGGSGHGGWVTVRKYDGGRPQLRRRIGK
ncbi:hypothetical protein EJB05_41424 [Eragrostis curvula]|uniref:Uncharacterized protein n=1 Tax=Eragrostis curvula TaxID=38414 RepID=A0A5J9T9F0_9POAL|nr:hypothetical protein EJB05_41424 [Eragrostis curvula]